MRTKISLALGKRRPLSRETAWGCFTANLAVPGSGSLVAGRVVGYLQLGLAVAGLLLTLAFSATFAGWYFANAARLRGTQVDPVEALVEIWNAAKWPLLGIGIFALGWFWGVVTGLAIVNEAKRNESSGKPPVLGRPGL